jgi:hypothetical protein
MKTFSFRTLLVVVLAVLLSACANEYQKVIPADAMVVAELDLKSIVEKSDLESQKDKLSDIMNKLKKEDKQLAKLINIIESGNTGLDLLKPVYMFLEGENPYLVLAVSDQKELENNILSFSTEYDDIDVTTSNELSWIEVDGELVGAMNKNALIVGYEASRSTYRDFFENEGDSFFDTEAGKLMKKHAGDATVVVNMKAIPSVIKHELYDELVSEVGDVEGMDDIYEQLFKLQMAANVEFEKGKASVNLYVANVDEEVKNWLEKIDHKELEQVPSENLITLGAVALNGSKNSEQLEDALKVLREELSYDDTEVLDMFVDLCKNINGTGVVSLSGDIDEEEFEALCILPVSQRKVNDVIDYFGEHMPVEINISGDSEHTVVTNMPRYTYGNVSKSFDKASNAKSCCAYYYFSLRPIADWLLEDMMRYSYGEDDELKRVRKDLKNAVSTLDYADLKVDTDSNVSLNLYLTDDSDNILAIVLDKVVNFVHDNLDRM